MSTSVRLRQQENCISRAFYRALFAVCAVFFLSCHPVYAAAWLTRATDLPGIPHALRIDGNRKVIYLSAPQSNRVYFVDLNTLTLQRRVYVGFHPTGIDLSADANTLYAALNQAGAIGVYDLVNDAGTQLDISLTLGDSRTWDVVESEPGIVFASANPCGGGFGYIVRADIQAQTATRVANQDIIRCTPIFAPDPTSHRLFVANYDFPSVVALDTTQTSAPVLSSLPPSGPTIQPGLGMAISPAGDKLAFGDGTIIRTSDYSQVGSIHAGVPLFSADGAQIVVAYDALPIQVYRYDATTLAPIDTIATTCNAEDGTLYPTAIEPMPGYGWAIISGSWLCTLQLIPDGIFIDGFGG